MLILCFPAAALPAAASPEGTCAPGVDAVRPADARELTAALARARPGTVISLRADTVYSGAFTLSASGTAAQPIQVCGPRSAVLDAGSINAEYGMHLQRSSYSQLIGFTVTDSLKGIVADEWRHGVIADVAVHDIGQEGIHLRVNSADDTIRNSVISDTGRSHRADSTHFGEGLYIGSANNNWSTYTHGLPDRTRDIMIIGNRISRTTAESIDVKEGTSGGKVLDNHFDGTGMVDPAGADSWVDAKGDDWLFEGNVGTISPADGFQVHVKKGWGRANTFIGNTMTLNHRGYGVDVHNNAPQAVVACSNTITGTQAALTNLPVRCPGDSQFLPTQTTAGHGRRDAIVVALVVALIIAVSVVLRRRRRR